MSNYGLYINGQIEMGDGDRLDVVNPTTGEVTGTITDASSDDVNRAVQAAKEAFLGEWGSMSPSDRSRKIHLLADAIEARSQYLAIAESRDNGKLYKEMIGQLKAVPKWYRYFGGLADKIEGSTVPMDQPSLFNYTVKEPLGVIGCITPWNSPILLGAWKFAPALAAGNTIVVKPSEHASVSTLEFAKCFEDAGFPAGVFNVITGSGVGAGNSLVEHPGVSKISFTGSEYAGAAISAKASGRLIKATTELGGKSANILFEDCDLDSAVNGILAGIFAAGGQTCVAGSRALVHESVYDEVVARLIERTERIRVGDPLDETTEMGPIANSPQFEKVQKYTEIAKEEGATLLTGGQPKKEAGEGFFYEPTIFGGVTPSMRIAREEVFGPILSLMKFSTDAQALEMANDSDYGLAAGLWTQNISRAIEVSRKLEAGTVWVNTYRAISHNMPFGGYKRSGVGRENGQESLQEFLQTKSVWIETAKNTGDPFALKV